ncbi:MAG: TlpA disulfide reductase family protein [Actinomycetota bacterium]
MKRSRAISLIASVLVLLTLAAVIGWIAGRSGHNDASAGRAPTSIATDFNVAGLPPVHVDRCPSGADLLPAPATGQDLLPDLTLECIGEIGTTETVALRRLGGVPTVVNLWASWCVPCRQEMPDLQQAYAAAGRKVRILGINTKDSAESARATMLSTGVRYANLADPGAKVRAAAGSNFMPTTLFVAADGRVVFRKVGPMTAAQMRQLIAEHLGVTL